MRYWWVNQNQTFQHEVAGGYLWSPKCKSNGSRNPFYEFMREVAPGDLVFSFCDTRIRAVGIASSHAYEAPKPEEFGQTGRNWSAIGWRVDVAFTQIPQDFRPVAWMELLRPLLPQKYSPLLADGRGVQSIYLTELPPKLALTLAQLISEDVLALARSETVADPPTDHPSDELLLWENHLHLEVETDPDLSSTEISAIILARRGQGLFKKRVQRVESSCRITGVSRPEHLRASHCKPWRDSNNQERLNGENGLLLTPSIDHLFDRGFVSFEDDGRLLVSPVAHRPSLHRMGIPATGTTNVGGFRSGQTRFLEYHRDCVFLRATVRREFLVEAQSNGRFL